MAVPPDALARASDQRQRAHNLRILASGIEQSGVFELHRFAGIDTWDGPGPQLCRQQLDEHSRRLRLAIDELRTSAQRLDIEAASLVGGYIGPGPR